MELLHGLRLFARLLKDRGQALVMSGALLNSEEELRTRQDVLQAARRFAQLRTQKTAEDFAEDMKVNLEEMAVWPAGF